MWTIVTAGSLQSAPIVYALNNGQSILNSLIFTEQETNITLFALGSGSLGFTISNSFDVAGPLITIAIQDFDNALPEWTYSNNVPFFDNGWGTDGYYDIIDISSASPLSYSSFSNNILGENDLNDEGDNGTTGFATITFDTVNISSFDNVNLSFDWEVVGYVNNSDDARYEVIYDDVPQGLLFLHDGNGIPNDGSGTISIDVPSSVNTIGLRIRIRNNGANGYSGFDNFKLTSVFDGLLYTNNSWVPNPPSGSTGSDNALILDGTYIVGSNVVLDNLFINVGAATTVAFGQSISTNGNVVNNGTLELNSVSTSYSSLIVEGSVIGTSRYSRHVNNTAVPGEDNSNDLIAPPVTGQTFADFAAVNSNIVENPGDNSQKLFGPLNKSTGTYQNFDTDIPADASEILSPGNGYRAGSTDNGNFTFEGDISTGNINVPIVVSGPIQEEWNLIGNPYPSYISLADWLATNESQLAAPSIGIWGYDGDASDGWTVWNQAYLDIHPDAVVTPGQGFLVASIPGGGTISFTPSMRSIGTTDDFIVGKTEVANNNASYLKIEAISNDEKRKTEFYFNDNGTLGLDPGYDAITFGGTTTEFDLYSHLVEDNDGSAICVQTIGNYDLENNSILPLGLNVFQGQQITIKKSSSSTINENVLVYLEDNETNTFTLLNDSDYTFTTNTDLNGTGRFYLRFETNALSTVENELIDLNIYNSSNPKQLHISGVLNDKSILSLFDIQGRLVMSKSLEPSITSQSINLNSVADGVYVVKIESNNLVKSQKLIIN